MHAPEEEVVAASPDGRLRAVVVRDVDGVADTPLDYDGRVGTVWLFPEAQRRHGFGHDERSPSPHADVVWEMDRFYRHPYVDFTREQVLKHVVRRHGTSVICPLFMLDHSGIWLRLGRDMLADPTEDARSKGRFVGDEAGWDTSLIGFVLDSAAAREAHGLAAGSETVLEALREEVAELNSWVTGDVWGVRVDQRVEYAGPHVWRTAVFTGSRSCDACGLMPLDADDDASPCPGPDEPEWAEVEGTACWGYVGHDWAAQAAAEAMEELGAR